MFNLRCKISAYLRIIAHASKVILLVLAIMGLSIYFFDAKTSRRDLLFSIAEFFLPRNEAEEWLDSAEEYYESYAQRTSNRRANLKLTFEVSGLILRRLWKPFAAAVGLPKLWDIIGKLADK